MIGEERTARRVVHAPVVVGAFGVAAAGALIAVVVPHLTAAATDPEPVTPSYAPSSCMTPTASGSDADWTICWDED